MLSANLSNLYQERFVSTSLDKRRINLANREIETLALLMKLNNLKFPESGVLLDLGCGDRYLERPVSEKGIEYLGLDIDTIDFEKDKFSIEQSSVDIVVCLAVLEHLKDPSLVMSEIYRCLKPGGAVYLSTPNFRYDFKNFYNDPTHVRPYTPHGAEVMLKLYGFECVKTFPGLRCKSKHWYTGALRFWRACYLLPFAGQSKWMPSFLGGRAKSFFMLAIKPIQGA